MHKTPTIRKGSSLEIWGAPSFDTQRVTFFDKIGEGAFGRVRLALFYPEPSTAASSPKCRKKSPSTKESGKSVKDAAAEQQIVAVKILSKQMLIEAKQVDHVYNEMNLTSQLQHNFIVNTLGIQQDQRSIYIMMEHIHGGELFKHLQKFHHFEAPQARFYAAQIILVFEYLHDRHQMVYRDLKPENVLLQSNGFVKLSDFGFIKKLKPGERTYTLCGTPEYLAPEILLNRGHGKAVDWYCLGMFLYEMMRGKCPFMNNDPYEIFKMILSQPIPFPKGFDEGAKSLIRHLTDHDLSRRYGNLKNGSQDVKNHRFFKGTNFDAIASMTIQPPYIPDLQQKTTEEVQKSMQKYTTLNLPENKDESRSPALDKLNDPFFEWFLK